MKKIVWVNGSFDVITRAHIDLLRYAKSLGDELIVGVDSDSRVTEKKGETRPFNKLGDRIAVLESIKYVDYVCMFITDQGLETLIKNFEVDIICVGSDWKGKKIIGEEHAKAVVYFDRVPGYSTTRVLEYGKENK